MTIIEDQQAKYLIKSLQHHPSPYVIFCKEGEEQNFHQKILTSDSCRNDTNCIFISLHFG